MIFIVFDIIGQRKEGETYSKTSMRSTLSIKAQLCKICSLQPSGNLATIKWVTVGGRTSAFVAELQRLTSDCDDKLEVSLWCFIF